MWRTGASVMAGSASLEEILSSCLSPENLRRTQAEAALKVPHPYLWHSSKQTQHRILRMSAVIAA